MSGYFSLTSISDTVSFKNSKIGVTVAANNGDDKITGSNFGDRINGGLGNDQIIGGLGNDFLNGGNGADRLFGGGGNDTFVFAKGEISNGPDSSLDSIIDFQGAGGFHATQDFIRLQGFGVGSTFSFVRDATAHLNGAIYEVFDPTDGYTARVLIQFADANYTGTTDLVGAANGGFVQNSDFGWV